MQLTCIAVLAQTNCVRLGWITRSSAAAGQCMPDHIQTEHCATRGDYGIFARTNLYLAVGERGKRAGVRPDLRDSGLDLCS